MCAKERVVRNGRLGPALLPGLMRHAKGFWLSIMRIEGGVTLEEELVATSRVATMERSGEFDVALQRGSGGAIADMPREQIFGQAEAMLPMPIGEAVKCRPKMHTNRI